MGKVRGTRTISRGGWPWWSLAVWCTASIPSFKLHAAEAPFPQVKNSPQGIQDSDFVVQLRAVCDSVLYAYLSKVAGTPEKRHYLDLSHTAVNKLIAKVDAFLDDLHKFGVLDLQLSIFQPYDLRDLLVAIGPFHSLSIYFGNFISDPDRSKEFHYEGGPFHTFIATRYMRFLRTNNSR